MSEPPHYNPDGPPIGYLLQAAGDEGVRFSLMREYLDNPTVQELHDDWGYQQRLRPASEQIADLERYIVETLGCLDELVCLKRNGLTAENRATLDELEAFLGASVEEARIRIGELKAEGN
ncbi:MAG: hypothetical protein ACYCSF_13135 [Acidimicrobiales bacterium]